MRYVVTAATTVAGVWRHPRRLVAVIAMQSRHVRVALKIDLRCSDSLQGSVLREHLRRLGDDGLQRLRIPPCRHRRCGRTRSYAITRRPLPSASCAGKSRQRSTLPRESWMRTTGGIRSVVPGASPHARPPPSADSLAKAVEAQRLQLVRVHVVVLSNISVLRESYGLELDGARALAFTIATTRHQLFRAQAVTFAIARPLKADANEMHGH